MISLRSLLLNLDFVTDIVIIHLRDALRSKFETKRTGYKLGWEPYCEKPLHFYNGEESWEFVASMSGYTRNVIKLILSYIDNCNFNQELCIVVMGFLLPPQYDTRFDLKPQGIVREPEYTLGCRKCMASREYFTPCKCIFEQFIFTA